MSNLLDVFDGNEIFVYIAETYNKDAEELEDGNEFNWERVAFRRNVDPDIPDTARDVYDGIRLIGTKPQRQEGINLTIEAEFQGFKRGLWKYENSSGLLVKIEIEPHGDYEEEVLEEYGNVSYYLNWSPENSQFSPPDEGDTNVTLEGSFSERMYDMPTLEDVEDWMDEEEE